MKAKKRVICTVGVILIVVALSMLLMGCPAKDERKHVVIEVINPMTGEPLWFPYTGAQGIPKLSITLSSNTLPRECL